MTHTIHALKKYLVALVIGAMLFGAFVPYTQAQTTYYVQQGQSQQELIAYLQALLLQLQTLLAQQQGNGGTTYYYPGTSNYSYDIEVETDSARNIEDDEATLQGEIDLDGASYATVWFQYGEGGDMDEDTSKRRITSDGSFRADIDDLDEDEKYYFRAVAEDPSGYRVFGNIERFIADDGGSSSHNDGDEPYAKTGDADDVDERSAEMNGEVDMNDFNNGIVFFVYGEDEDAVEDAEDEDAYNDVDEDGDNLQTYKADSDLDGNEEYYLRVSGLDEDEDYYFRICVEYDDEDNDETLECGDVEHFQTDGNGGSSNNGDDEPDARTQGADDIDDDSARMRGEVDMNDFDNGIVFFVYGEDEDAIEDVEDEDRYSDVDEDGDDLQKYKADSDLDGRETYWLQVSGLDDNTDYYYRICVEYEDEDGDEVLACGGVGEFRTSTNSGRSSDSFDADDISSIETRYVDPSVYVSDDEYTLYTVRLRNGAVHSIKVGAWYTLGEMLQKSKYTGTLREFEDFLN